MTAYRNQTTDILGMCHSGKCRQQGKGPNAGDRAELMQFSDLFTNVKVHMVTGMSEEVQKRVAEHSLQTKVRQGKVQTDWQADIGTEYR